MNLVRDDSMRSRTVDHHIDIGAITRTGHRMELAKNRELNRRSIEKYNFPYLQQIGKYSDGTGGFDSSFQMGKPLGELRKMGPITPAIKFFFLFEQVLK